MGRFLKDWILWTLAALVAVEFILSQYLSVIGYLIFPTIGALIGYLTNTLAVWMIFNPKRPMNFLFFKWQGLVPKSKDRIGENLASTVEEELVNPQVIKEYLISGERKDGIKKALVQFVLKELDREYPSIKEILGANYVRLRSFLLDYYMNNYEAILKFLDRLMQTLSEKPLEEFIDGSRYSRIRRWLEDYGTRMMGDFSRKKIGDILGISDLESLVSRILDRIDENALSSLYNLLRDKSIYDLYPRSVEISDRLIEAFADKLRDPQFRRRLSRMIIEAVKENVNLIVGLAIDGLGLFVDLESKVSNYIETLASKIESDPAIVEDVKREVEKFLKRPLSHYVDERQFVEAASRVIGFVRQDIINLARKIYEVRISDVVSAELMEKMRIKALEWLDSIYEENRSKPVLKDIYERYSSEIREMVLRILTGPQMERLIGETIDRIAEKPIGNPRRRIGEYIDVEKFVEDFIDSIFDRVVDVIEALVERIEVRKIVKERIDAYSVEEMEEVVFGMMRREFRTIELLGIPIGFAVGLIQTLLRLSGM